MLTHKFLQLQGIYFRLLGFNIFASSGFWTHPHRTFYSIMSLVTFLPLTVTFCVRHGENVVMVTDGLCSVLVDLLALYKFGLILWQHKDFQQLIEQLRNMLQEESRESAYDQIIDRVNRREQFISGLYKNCFALAAISACLLPLIRMLGNFLRSDVGLVQLELPFPSVYPWDNRHALNYFVSYVWNVSAALGVLLPTVCVDTLFCSLTHNLCALFEIAQYKMEKLVGTTLAESQLNLGNALSIYQRSLEVSEVLNRLFRPLVNMQFLVASLHLCVLCYQLAANLTQPEVLFYAAFTGSILSQVYLYCWSGEYVKTESAKLAASIYSSNWYEIRCRWSVMGQPLLITTIRSQRGSRIDGHFWEANMETFLSIVTNAMSYITLIRSFSK